MVNLLTYPNLIRLATYHGKGLLDHSGQKLAHKMVSLTVKLALRTTW